MAKKSKSGKKVYKQYLLLYRQVSNIWFSLCMHDVNLCPLMHIRRKNNKINRQPMIRKANGTRITIISLWDALCYLYTNNFPLPKKRKKIPTFVHPKDLKQTNHC